MKINTNYCLKTLHPDAGPPSPGADSQAGAVERELQPPFPPGANIINLFLPCH